MVDDQLGTALEDVDEAHRAVRAVELVVLVDLDHGELAALGIERIPLPGQVLLLREQLLAGGRPLLSGGDLRIAHSTLLARRNGRVLRPTEVYDVLARSKSSKKRRGHPGVPVGLVLIAELDARIVGHPRGRTSALPQPLRCRYEWRQANARHTAAVREVRRPSFTPSWLRPIVAASRAPCVAITLPSPAPPEAAHRPRQRTAQRCQAAAQNRDRGSPVSAQRGFMPRNDLGAPRGSAACHRGP